MKVLHVISSVSPARGGTTAAILGTVKALRACNVDAEIAATNDHIYELLDVPLNKKVEYNQVPVQFFSRFSPPINPILEFAFSRDLTSWLWQNIQNYDLVEIHSIFGYACSCAGVIARKKRIPYIINLHGQLSPWVFNQKRLKKQIYTLLVERGNLNNAAAIHCTTIPEAQEILKFRISAPTFVNPLGIDPLITLPDAKQKLHALYNIPPATPIILFLSRIHPKKRPDLLLKALSSLAAKYYDFHLIIAGSGEREYVEHIHNLCLSLKLKSHTTFPGLVTEDKALLLQGSDIFILPSFAENFGIAVAEAMTVGLPVIITPGVQLSSDIASRNAGLIVDGEVNALTEAIKQLLISAELRHELGANGKRLASQRYTWETVTHNLISVYKDILKGERLMNRIYS